MSSELKKHWSVSCTRCATVAFTDVATKKKAEWEFRLSGWSKKNSIGWVCPDCVNTLRLKHQPEPKHE